MKFVAVIFVALFVSINAYPYAVIEVAKVASPVGHHGPALINLHWPNSWPGSYWGGKGQEGGSSNLGGKGQEGGSGSGNWGGSGGSSEGWGSGGGWGHAGSVGYTGDAAHGHDGKYVAINRGAIHVAPLIGHSQSVKSQNYEPAPGTTW